MSPPTLTIGKLWTSHSVSCCSLPRSRPTSRHATAATFARWTPGFARRSTKGWRGRHCFELDADAARFAGTRVTAPSRVIADRVERALPSALPADVVLLNPPRTGVDAAVTTALNTARVRAIVYVETECAMSPRLFGRLTFMASGGGRRYVNVHVSCALTDNEQIAALGHELRHAVEIADAPSVVDEASLAAQYARIGFASHGVSKGSGYETYAAKDAAQRVWSELSRTAE